jgi:hypothetical protein
VPGRNDLGAVLFKPATRGISDPFNQDANVRFFERHTRDEARLLRARAAAGPSSAIPRCHHALMARICCPFDETRNMPKRASNFERAIRGADRFVDAGIGKFDPMKRAIHRAMPNDGGTTFDGITREPVRLMTI